MAALPSSHDHISYLPDEIRLMIAELAVIEDHDIDINSKPQQAALSRVWRDLREDILLIYYTQNKFIDTCDDLDRSRGVSFVAPAEFRGINITRNIIMYPILPVANPDAARTNLMGWMREVYTIGTSAQYRAHLINYDNVKMTDFEYQEMQLAGFFKIMRIDWAAERKRANADGTDMISWTLKELVI